ncbi:MAG: type IX secretion system membrane protein PorP/SprF [Sediminibacterium sp.]|nr:type IX secretion system membrane protein PorP/SprF [Sediminibacterium sp.]MBP6144514.1 type IX secretion system membrane protein PorP/SprF [Sediminibacterium sp.]
MRNFYTYILVCFCFLQMNQALAQDPIFSQVQNSASVFNPALTGAGVQKRVVRFKYRDANGGKGAVLNSVAFFNMEQKIKMASGNDYFALGANVLSEKIGGGLLVQNSATLSGAYYNAMNEDGNNGLSAGLSITYGNKMLDMAQVKTQDMFGSFGFPSTTSLDPAAANYKMNYLYLNAGIGYNFKLGENDLVHLGTALFRVNRPKDSKNGNSKIDSKLVFESKYKKLINDDESIELIANHQVIANASITTVGAMYSKLLLDDAHLIELGLLHRVNYAIIPYVGIGINKAKFGLSYDVTMTQYKNLLNSMPTIELTFSWDLN